MTTLPPGAEGRPLPAPCVLLPSTPQLLDSPTIPHSWRTAPTTPLPGEVARRLQECCSHRQPEPLLLRLHP